MVDISVPNSVSLITGAASGIGRHLAIHASNLGHDVVLIDLDANGLDAVSYTHLTLPTSRSV